MLLGLGVTRNRPVATPQPSRAPVVRNQSGQRNNTRRVSRGPNPTNTTFGTAPVTASPAPTPSTQQSPYTDAALIAGMNSIEYSSSIPDSQIQRVLPQVVVPGTINPGTVLAHALNLPYSSSQYGATLTGTNGIQYEWNGAVWTAETNPTLSASITGTTVSSVPATAAASSTTPTAITNVASALGINPTTISSDTTGYWNSFFAALANQGIAPATANSATIQAAYSSFSGGAGSITSALSSPVVLIIGGALLIYAVSKKG
jgi:hypothetical protein